MGLAVILLLASIDQVALNGVDLVGSSHFAPTSTAQLSQPLLASLSPELRERERYRPTCLVREENSLQGGRSVCREAISTGIQEGT
jgi:hypothetical protein